MGNNSSKQSVNFFEEIKMTTSYRDFVMKMNNILSKKDVDWSINLNQIHQEEINLYWDLIKHIFVFIIEYLFEESSRRQDIEKEKIEIIKIFLDILQKLIAFMLQMNAEKLYELFWTQIDQEFSAEQIIESGYISKVKIDDKDFIAADDQIPIFLKLLISISNLLFRNHFTLITNETKFEKFAAILAENGWTKFPKNNEFISNRIVLLEFILLLIFTENKFIKLKSTHSNSVISFFKCSKNYLGFLKSLIYYGTNYNENGILPYSAYFFKEFMENNLYFSALSINLSIIFLEEEIHLSKLEKVNPTCVLPVFLVKKYVENHGLPIDLEEEKVLEEEAFMMNVLEKIASNIVVYLQKSKTILPNSLKEVL